MAARLRLCPLPIAAESTIWVIIIYLKLLPARLRWRDRVFSTDSMAGMALLLTKMLFLSRIRPKNSVSDPWVFGNRREDVRIWG
jgi:hypothetical protein